MSDRINDIVETALKDCSGLRDFTCFDHPSNIYDFFTNYIWSCDTTITAFDKSQEDLIYGVSMALCLIWKSTHCRESAYELWRENLRMLEGRES